MLKVGFFFVGMMLLPGNPMISIEDEKKLDFPINTRGVFENKVQLYYALMTDDQVMMSSNFNENISFEKHIKPLDIFDYHGRRGEEEYYPLLTKTVYGLPQHVSYFSEQRLSDPQYLQQVMPYNAITKSGNDYHLKVGFGAPDIAYTLAFYNFTQLQNAYPGLVEYFRQFDRIQKDPGIVVVQHNHWFGKVLGQQTSKMSLSVTRYYDAGNNQTLAVNYTLSYIQNLPPALIGGGGMLINQMKKGIIALVRDTRSVCEKGNMSKGS